MDIETNDAITSAKRALEKSHSVAQAMIEQKECQRTFYRYRLFAEIMLDYIAEAEDNLSIIK